MKRVCTLLLLSILLLAGVGFAAPVSSEPVFTLTGLVKHPLQLTQEDLGSYRAVSVRLTEVARDGSFQGVHIYQGVPLQNLLQAAGVEKEGGEFPKAIDLALRVRNREGKRALLSWAEVAYGRPEDVLVAFSDKVLTIETGESAGVPHALPKLVLANDFFSDRSLDGLVSIEVVDPTREAKSATVPLQMKPGRRVEEVATKIVWGGNRFEGVQRFSGTPLVDLLKNTGIENDPEITVLVHSKDGYRSLLSMGELFWSPLGRRILLADRMDGRPLGEKGELWLILPDSSANRYVRKVESIELLHPSHQAKLMVIGVGPGDTSLITLEALAALAKADAVAAPGDIQQRFARYLVGKEILFDPFAFADPDRAQPLSVEERERLKQEEWRANADKIRRVLEAGRDVAFLDWGDPMIFGSSRWIREFIEDDRIETVPGLSSFNAANAVINRDLSAHGALVITAPRGLRQNQALLAAAAKNGDTLVIFMGLPDLPDLVPLLQRHYAPETPLRLVYAAGISGRERQVDTTLETVLQAVENEKEKFLGLIYVGPCLTEGNAACN
ncbi:MAG: SAM-dependent methyltransferase [Syntrophotaleaceae bacterium]